MTERALEVRGPTSAVARKELVEAARDGRFRATAVATLALAAVALGFGLAQARATRVERESAAASADEHWRTQDEKNPHVAAHYGTYVFKPAGALPFVDPGIEPFVGGALKLEAHRRNLSIGARALDATGLSRFGGLSLAAVLQLLVPLLAVGLAFGAFSGERERGTLRQVLSLGVPPRALLWGKILGLGAALASVLVPAGLLVAIAGYAWAAPGEALSVGRAASLVAAYAGYLFVFLALTLGVSARAASSRAALVAMLGFWVFAAQIAPRLADDAAARIAPTPTSRQIAEEVRRGIAEGLPGGPPREDRLATLTEAILEREGFAGAETLMDASLLAGLELEAEATFENEVIDACFARLAAATRRQEQVAEAFGAISPVIAIRALSRGLAGTDLDHHQDFEAAAERHRRRLIDALHRAFAERGGSAGWDYRAGREVWERAPAFVYAPPSVGWVLERRVVSLGSLLLWVGVALAFAARATGRLRVVP